MNKLIKEQLLRVTATEIDFTENSKEIFIPKTVKFNNSSLKVGSVYNIELEDFILNPTLSSTLASNWNAGIVPKYKQYIAEIVDNMGKMIKVNGVAIENPSDSFYGWLPSDAFKVLNKE